MPSFVLTTLGCKVNQYDGAVFAAALSRAGLEPHSPAAGHRPDLVVVHTCCVTAAAMAKSRYALRHALRAAPGAAVLVTGCYARYDGERLVAELASLGVGPGRAFVIARQDDGADPIKRLAGRLGLAEANAQIETRRQPGAGDRPCSRNDKRMSAPRPLTRAADSTGADIKTRRRAAVKRNREAGSSPRAPDSHSSSDASSVCSSLGPSLASSQGFPLDRFPGHQRAFVKVQDGCDAFCAYCVVPFTRPIMEWRPVEVVEEECRRLLRAGHRELVLCGVFLGAYGHSTARRRGWAAEPSLLPQLVRRIGGLQDEGLWRLRLSSLEPGDLSEDLLAAFGATACAAWHFHLPLQSGSGRILRRMNRQYSSDDYRRAIDRIRAAQEDAAITTDILVGFPGEDDADFCQTLEIARYAGFSKIHAFPFSAIRGTAAWTYRDEAPPAKIVRERLAELAAVERELAMAYRARFVGRTMEALVESPARAAGCHASASPRGEACDQAAAGNMLAANGAGSMAPGQAMTDRHLTVFFSDPASGAAPRPGEVHSFRIENVHSDGLTGRVEVIG